MSLGWAILGTGRFAAGRIAPALNKAHGCRAVAVISRDRGRAAAFAAEHGIPRVYDDLTAALRDPSIEALWVATPHSMHREPVLAAARAGRHVLCEKPLATSVAEAQQMVVACRQAGVKLGTGFHLRHHPLHIEVRRLIQEGSAGPVTVADAEWSLPSRPPVESAAWRSDPSVSGGGIITGTGIHVIDLLRFVLADEIEAVTALIDPPAASGGVEQRAAVLLQLRGGVIGSVRCARGVRSPANDLILECQSAAIRVRSSIDEQARGALETQGMDSNLAGVPVGTDLYALEAEAFARAVAAGHDPDASGIDGLRVTQATVAVYESAATGRRVVLPSDS